MQKYFKFNNGITLITLVITIIILLILAGIVVSLTVGERGLIKRTEQSGVSYSESEARESLELVLLDMQAEKVVNSEYDKDLYLTRKLEEQGMIVNGDIVIVNGWQFTIDRNVPQIGESLGKGQKNEAIKITIRQTVSTDYVKSTLRIEIESEGEISSIKIAGEEVSVTEKQEGKYVVTKDVMENGIYSVLAKDSNGGYQIGSEQVSELTEDMKIWNVEDMILFRDRVNSGRTFEGKTVTIMADIDLKGTNENQWIPIGNKEGEVIHYFSGNLEGNNYAISNLYIKGKSTCRGLFGNTKGNIRNIILEELNIEGNSELGGIAGRNEGIITRCYVKGTITGYEGTIGGIAGRNSYGTISQCVNDAEIISETASIDKGQFGGIVGSTSRGIVELCYNLKNIKTKEGSNAGGIVGWVGYSSIIRNSYNIGEITGNATNVGGIAGAFSTPPARDSKIENCYNIANISGKAVVGNIIGYFVTNDAEIKNTYYLKSTRNGCGMLNSTGICETIEKEEKDLKNSVQTLGDAFTNDIQNEDGTWKYNNGYPILKWQLEQ